MTVSELIKKLSKLDQSSVVVVQEYDGANDIHRPVITVSPIAFNQLSKKHGSKDTKRTFVSLSGMPD